LTAEEELASLKTTPRPDPTIFRAELQSKDERTASFYGRDLKISIRPQEQYPFTHFRIERKDGTVFGEPLFYSYLALGQLLTDYDFMRVLEIGSRNGVAAQAIAFTGKKVITCEILDTFDARIFW